MNFIINYNESSDNDTIDDNSCEHVSDNSEHSDSDELEEEYEDGLNRCPVVYVEEKCHYSTDGVDTRAYIYYNQECKMYHIIGKRNDTKSIKGLPYSFMCKKSEDIISFLSSILEQHKINIELHDSPMPRYVTFDFLSEHIKDATEIVAYDFISCQKKTHKHTIKDLLSICRHFKHSNFYI